MNMKFITSLSLLCVMAVPLMGAKCSGTAEASVECGAPPATGCKKAGKVSGSWEWKQKSPSTSTLEGIDVEAETFDAALWSVSLSGSNVDLPNYGTALLKLVDSTTNTVIASQNFGWYRSGTVLLFSNPNAVNDWAINNAGTADTISYETAEFLTSENVGNNNLVMIDKYENEQLAYASYSWRRENFCPKRLDRHGNQIIYCP